MRKLLAAILALFVCIKSSSQNIVPQTFEIRTDTIPFQIIDSLHLLVLEDKDNAIDFTTAQALYKSDKFHYSNKAIDSNLHSYWFVYILHNAMSKPARIALNSMSDYDNFYVLQDSIETATYISGVKADKNIKNGLKLADCIPVEMQPGKSMLVFQHVENTGKGLAEGFGIAVDSTDQIVKEYYTDIMDKQGNYFTGTNLLEAFIIGMVLIAVFMNLFFYKIVKEKLYLYFALFALFLGINRLYGITLSYFFFESPSLRTYVEYLGYAWIFIIFFLTRFFQSFLDSKKQFPKLNLTLNILLAIYVTIYVVRLAARIADITMPQWTRLFMTSAGFVAIPLFLLILQILSLKKGKANRYLFGGSVFHLTLLLVSQLATPEGFDLLHGSTVSTFLYYNYRLLEAVCLALLIASLTWVLMMRFIELRRQNAQQALETERLAKEKEIEKNELIEQQKIQLEKDVAQRTSELKQSLDELKATQKQLIQSEKMASLGELTAGIAHEIQNPLNFVNNFSEVSNELIDEIKGERSKPKGERNEELEDEILNDIKQNLEKINHHGKRADAIVKGMLQHSRISSGQKELTNINALCDEYVRLAYHGLRAKDKDFNATIKTEFDESIGNINIIPQDIGRVLLNLYNNALYAVSEKKKQQQENYEPTVLVKTKKLADTIAISVQDNGNGIPQNIIDKIFQPFFTTKPTGEGTGLGLSLSYDIIKAHGGEIKVNSKERESTEFIVVLPATV